MPSYTDFEPTGAEVMDALAAFVMALSAHLSEEAAEQVSAYLQDMTHKMRQDGKDRAAILATALSNAIHIPFRTSGGDH